MSELRDEVQRMLGENVADDPFLLEAQVYGTWEVIPGTPWEGSKAPPTDVLRLLAPMVNDLQRVVLRLAEEIEKLQTTANRAEPKS